MTDKEYEEYASLLLQRDALHKECDSIQIEYINAFGEKNAEIFQIKLDCIALKKTIYYCQRARNHSESIDLVQLNSWLNEEMKPLREQLKQMREQNRLCAGAKTVNEAEHLRAKKLYREIAKRLHPDLNPAAAQNEALQELWQRAMDAYRCGNAEELEELTVLIDLALAEAGLESERPEIADIAEKIKALRKEIVDIMTTDPYRLRELLESPDLMEQKSRELEEEKQRYIDYRAQLQVLAAGFGAGEDGVKWTIN